MVAGNRFGGYVILIQENRLKYLTIITKRVLRYTQQVVPLRRKCFLFGTVPVKRKQARQLHNYGCRPQVSGKGA